jgi:hypothetical protein
MDDPADEDMVGDRELRRRNIFLALDIGLITSETAERLLHDLDIEAALPTERFAVTH